MKNKQNETIVKGIRLHKRLFEQAQQVKEKYEVPISFNRFVVNAVEKEIKRKGAKIDN
ncbi:YlcI/YnfO family protein [Priestia megaterium]|uniref:YlcI/YnfO family protein n=1 Tax=Priestia megaterium TaxID=1404 RepID=UPI002E1EA8A8|nr:YlcI/YnfO family protein [Priestia megaterium]